MTTFKGLFALIIDAFSWKGFSIMKENLLRREQRREKS